MQQILSDLLAKGYQVIWQTGSQFRSSIEQYKQPGVFISEFIYEMAFAYAAADVVVSRAGALSVSELCIVQKPAILIPFPNAAEDHQTKNARSLSDHQAAWLVEDSQLMDALLPAITTLLEDSAQCAMLAGNMKSFARPQAAADIAEQIIQLIPS
jgi:UDP-N-acetylglucosamine--N-acetylmuramyl-(pentapeptide) pyrophosphoryl-undecaprenol N-acetylglucosamine transferase